MAPHAPMVPTYTEPARHTPLIAEAEVLVLGGGPAGLMAAAAAARAGRRTLLVERYGFLGGMGTAAGVTNFCGLHANVHGQIRRVVRGLADDLLQRLREQDALCEPHRLLGGRIAAQAYDNAALKMAADELVLGHGARLLLHALAVGVVMQPDAQVPRVQALLVETRCGRGAIAAQVFIDASGDADLAAWAGVPYEKGPELLYPSTMFRVGGVDDARAGAAWEHMAGWMARAEAEGERFVRRTPIVRPQRHAGEWRANVTQLSNPDGSAVDGTDAWQLSAAEVQGRRQAGHFMRFLRRAAPGFERAYLLELAAQVGIRETRRVLGHARLTHEHVLGNASFDDTVGVSGWPLEAHVAGDVRFTFPPDIGQGRGYHHLPLGMIVAQGVDNLLVVGRCASMTHAGQSAARVSGACFAMGEAAGVLADLALARRQAPQAVPAAVVQQALQDQGVFLGRAGDRLPPD